LLLVREAAHGKFRCESRRLPIDAVSIRLGQPTLIRRPLCSQLQRYAGTRAVGGSRDGLLGRSRRARRTPAQPRWRPHALSSRVARYSFSARLDLAGLRCREQQVANTRPEPVIPCVRSLAPRRCKNERHVANLFSRQDDCDTLSGLRSICD